ncbi:MAG: ferritin-like domain-containing protein [Acidobacteriaceae bacterium]|jgi:ferritin-like metal-binding protein YciE
MKLVSANPVDLRELYNNTLQKTLDMEQQITDALCILIERATDPQLQEALETHLNETYLHVGQVEQIVTEIYGDPRTTPCKVTTSLIGAAQDLIKDAAGPSVRDAALIAAAQQVEHHEIAVYEALRNWAETLGEPAHAETFHQILDQEKHADFLLNGIAIRVNQGAQTRPHAA